MESFPYDILDHWLLPFLHLYRARAERRLTALGIHPGQLPALLLVSHQEGMSLKQLADALHVKPPTMTVSVQRMEKMGLLEKREDKKDQRVYQIYLTEKGKETLDEAKQIALDNYQLATEGITREELAIVKDCFTRMTENLKRDAGAPEAPPCP